MAKSPSNFGTFAFNFENLSGQKLYQIWYGWSVIEMEFQNLDILSLTHIREFIRDYLYDVSNIIDISKLTINPKNALTESQNPSAPVVFSKIQKSNAATTPSDALTTLSNATARI